ncbi:MAG: hypothetical protein U1G05_12000 [Kiritimatiellia bacterium]
MNRPRRRSRQQPVRQPHRRGRSRARPPPACAVGPAAWGFGSNWSGGASSRRPRRHRHHRRARRRRPHRHPRPAVTVGTLLLEQGAGVATNLLAGAGITFDGNGASALVSVAGGGSAVLSEPWHWPPGRDSTLPASSPSRDPSPAPAAS